MSTKRSTAGLFFSVFLAIVSTAAHAQLIELKGKLVEGINAEAGNLALSPAVLQSMMDPARVLQAYVIDKTAPRNERGGWGKRDNNVYKVGEQVDAVVQLANVGFHNPGEPRNEQQTEIRIIIRDMSDRIIWETPVFHTFKGMRKIKTPLPVDYFRPYFTVSAKVPKPGRYKVGFVFQDKTRTKNKRTEVEARVEVLVE